MADNSFSFEDATAPGAAVPDKAAPFSYEEASVPPANVSRETPSGDAAGDAAAEAAGRGVQSFLGKAAISPYYAMGSLANEILNSGAGEAPSQGKGADRASPSLIDRAAGSAADLHNTILGAAQGASPHTQDYKPLGPLVQMDYGPAYVDEKGKDHPFTSDEGVILHDPQTLERMVYARTPRNEESRASSLGRVLSLGMLTPASFPAVATEAVPSAAQRLLGDFKAAGVDPSYPAISQGRTARSVQNTLNDVPFAANAVSSRVDRATGQAGAEAERIASGYGAAETPAEAGASVQSGIKDFASRSLSGLDTADVPSQGMLARMPTRTAGFGDKAAALYNRAFAHFGDDEQIASPNTLAALRGPQDRFPTMPELGQAITNPTLARQAAIFTPRTEEIPAKVSSLVGPDGDPIVTQAAQTVEKGGTLTVPEMREFRSYIGRQLADPTLISDIPRGDLKNVYAGISQDLENAAQAKGPDALNDFRRADQYYQAGANRVERMENLLGKSPEGTFNNLVRMAQSGASADAGKLLAVRRSMPDSQWGDVASAAIRRMGEPTPGTTNPLSDVDFSPAKFVTEYSKLSDAGKDALFSSNVAGTPELRQSLDRLVRVAAAQKNVGRLVTPSNTSDMRRVLMTGGLGAWVTHDPVGATMALIGGNVGARAMMNPKFVNWLYSLPSVARQGTSAMPALATKINQLDTLARVSPDLAGAAETIRRSYLGTPAVADQQSSP